MTGNLHTLLVALALLFAPLALAEGNAGGSEPALSTIPQSDQKDLAQALYNRDLTRAYNLIEGHSIADVRFELDVTPLHALLGTPIKEPGAPPTPPHDADSAALLAALLEAGADPNAVTTYGTTPLRTLAGYGKDASNVSDLVRILVEHGADVNQKDDTGDTVLHVAAYKNRPALIDALLENGADPAIRNDDGQTPADYARAGGHDALAAMLSEQ